MNRCCFLSIIMISLLLFSCATNGEDAVNEGVIAEKTAPVIIIVEEALHNPRKQTFLKLKSQDR